MVVAVERRAAGEQVLVERLQRLLQHRVGHREAGLARVEQELDDVRRQQRIDVVVVAPHREVAGADLHRRQPTERAFHARAALAWRPALSRRASSRSHRRARARRKPLLVVCSAQPYGYSSAPCSALANGIGGNALTRHARVDRIRHQAFGQRLRRAAPAPARRAPACARASPTATPAAPARRSGGRP